MRLALLATGMIASVVTSCTTAPSPAPTQGSVIAISSDLNTSGPDNFYIVPLQAAIKLAIDDRGSIHGYRLLYEPFDDTLVNRWDPLKGEQNVRIMIRQPQVLAMVGPYVSRVALREIQVTNEAGLVMISPSNTADCLTSADSCAKRPSIVNNYFRIAGTDSDQASAAALFAISKLGLHRFAVLTDGTDYGTLLTDSFSKKLEANGGIVVFRQTYQQNANDYTLLLHQAHDAGAEAVFAGGSIYRPLCLIRAAMSGVFPADAYMLSSDWVTDTACAVEVGQGAGDHFLAMVSSSQPAPTNKVSQEFKTHGILPTTYSFGAYDCAQIIMDAIDRAIQADGGKLPTRREVLDAVAATHDFVGTTGTFTFQPNGDAVNPAISVYQLKNGKWTFWQAAS
jgi:branched-chain amino acid transport system substrate-binding protein